MYTKKLFKTTLFLGLLMSGTTAFAGSCGTGKILEIKEGGWNVDDLYIKLDYSVSATSHAEVAYIRYRSDLLNVERLRGIRSMAYLAFASGHNVQAWTHSDTCNNSSGLNIFS